VYGAPLANKIAHPDVDNATAVRRYCPFRHVLAANGSDDGIVDLDAVDDGAEKGLAERADRTDAADGSEKAGGSA